MIKRIKYVHRVVSNKSIQKKNLGMKIIGNEKPRGSIKKIDRIIHAFFYILTSLKKGLKNVKACETKFFLNVCGYKTQFIEEDSNFLKKSLWSAEANICRR